MRRRPVEPPARGAREEAVVRLPHEGRDAIACPLPRHLLEQPVALEAAPEERPAAERDGCRDLAELRPEIVVRDEDVGRELGVAEETRVPREEQSVLAPRAGDERPSDQMGPVGHVVAQDPEPAREPPHRPIDRKATAVAGFRSGLPHHWRTLAPFVATGERFEGGERIRSAPDRADKRREGGSEVGVTGGQTLEGAELRQVEEIAEQTRVVGREKPPVPEAAARERPGRTANQPSVLKATAGWMSTSSSSATSSRAAPSASARAKKPR